MSYQVGHLPYFHIGVALSKGVNVTSSTQQHQQQYVRTTNTQLAKLSFNHPSVVLTADVFQYFYSVPGIFFL